jgi:hypothetical protein
MQFFAVKLIQNRRGIGHPDGGHIAHGAVNKNLHRRCLSFPDHGCEILADLNAHINFLLQEQLRHLAFIGCVMGDMEYFTAGKAVDKLTALSGSGIIENGHANIRDIVIYDITENKHLNKGENKHHRTIAPVTQKLNKFLAYQFSDSKPAHRPSFFSNL